MCTLFFHIFILMKGKIFMENWIDEILNQKIDIINNLKKNGYFESVEKAGDILVESIKNGNKVILAGNGGSAADAQHFAGELVGRFIIERDGLPAISLCTDPTIVTSISNDYGYEELFSKELIALGRTGDVFVAISTSGNSLNCIKALKTAREREIKTIGFLGGNGGTMKSLCDVPLIVPVNSTPRIQEIHTFTVHLLCQMIESRLFVK